MSTLKLWAIAIDEVRGIFSADPDTADYLRAATAEHFDSITKTPKGLLGKIGPLLRGGPDPAAPRPGSPRPEDVEDLLSGRYIPPQRLVSAWNLLDFWLDTLALGTAQWPLSEPELHDFDFDLARAQVSSRFGLSELFKADLGISMTRCPGLAAGWVPGRHALAMAEAWPAGISELSEPHQDLATGVIAFLNDFTQWQERADSQNRPHPDLVAVFRT